MDEYIKVCARLGVETTIPTEEAFLRAMHKLDLPIYDLPTVVAYMDAIAKRDGDGNGWLWRPVRPIDRHHLSMIKFGQPTLDGFFNPQVASDFYANAYRIKNYARPIPLHALQRMEAVTKAIGDRDLAFMISDYATKDDKKIQPDPFLMVVITTTLAAPRYVIDFWDEPGFGLDKMLR